MDDRQLTYRRLTQIWPRLPEELQEALTDLAEAMVEELEKAESPNRADTPEE